MKKNNYSVLALLTVALLFGFVSCQKDKMGKVLFTATIESPTHQGKTAITNMGVMTWLDGDLIAVYDGKGSSVPCILSATPTGNGKTADFRPVSGEEPESGAYFAIYPSNIATGYNAVSLPDEYTYDDSRFDAPMYAYSTDNELVFKNLCSVVQLNLTATKPISSIEIAADLAITGQFVLDYDNGEPSMEPVEGYSGNLLTVTLGSDGVDCSSAKSFYIYLPLGNYGEMSFTFTAKDGSYCTKSLLSGEHFIVGRNTLNPLDFELSFPDRPYGSKGGQFSINEGGDKVWFSKGNLQYQASTDTWRFAEQQWEYVGSDNSNISSAYSGWIDLFGWGTSGWNSGAKCYQPYSASKTSTDYYPGGLENSSLTGAYIEADWAYHNAISNGGNEKHQWRTLTNDEWQHVIRYRTGADEKCGTGNINGVGGLIILPDDWTEESLPSGCDFTPGIHSTEEWAHNSYTLAQWAAMEAAGAVFLPAAGHRSDKLRGVGVLQVGERGCYWLTTRHNEFNAYGIFFYSNYSNFILESRSTLGCGFAVRPVRVD